MDFNAMTNEELDTALYKEVIYYDEDLYSLCQTLRRELPKKYMYRVISKLYRVRKMNNC